MLASQPGSHAPCAADAESCPDFHAIIPAGGVGSRLWPLSRADRPKFLHDLTGQGSSLLRQTWDRLEALSAGRTMVVTGVRHAEAVRGQLPDLDDEHLVLESEQKESAAAIGVAAAIIALRDPDAVVGSFAADHAIGDVAGFQDCVRQAVAVARRGYIVTLGIEPTHPSTAFGYIQRGGALGVEGAPDAFTVLKFQEKPDEDTARGYLRDGGFRWNAGMFVARAQVLLESIRRNDPELHAGLTRIAAAWDTPDRDRVVERVWAGLPKIAIDYVVAEPEAERGNVAVVCGDFDWDDVGDFASLVRLNASAEEPLSTVVLGDAAQASVRGEGGIVVPAAGRMVVVDGIPGVVVVDTPDALLVTTVERAQDVKRVVDELRESGRGHLL